MRALLTLVRYAWALPYTLLGLVLGALCVQRPRIASGAVIFDRAPRGFVWVLARLGWTAITFGHVILSSRRVDGALLRHELAHVRQYERLGVTFVPAYVALHLFAGYAKNPFETQAVRAERAATPAEPASAPASGHAGSTPSPSRPPR